MQLVPLHDPAGNGTRDQCASDHSQRRSTDGHDLRVLQSLRLKFLGPGHGSAGTTDEGQRPNQNAIGRVGAPEGRERSTRDVLQHQRNDCHGTKDEQRFPAALQGRKLCRKTNRREEDQQQGILDPRAEDDIEVEEDLKQQHQYRNDHGADHGIGHVDASQERNGLPDVSADEERDDPDNEGRELIKLKACHCVHDLTPTPLRPSGRFSGRMLLCPVAGAVRLPWTGQHVRHRLKPLTYCARIIAK